ncbi:uncharacterized protein LOC135538577 [Oncorhynchus masou masou]|uniref:uncharacterized protein LOC135538577 n=1 Tax=Oncorhynchus masou masou TaxID=90313 RepID=UPI0031838D39
MASSALLILLLYATSIGTTVSIEDIEYYTRERVEKSTELFEKSLEIVNIIVEAKDSSDWTSVLKKVLKFTARYGPAFGGFAGAAVNFALAFVGQDDPVLAEVKTQFAEVNRKLDSITLQINSLKTEVQWVAYTSVYSQDELKISNSWDMFTDFLTESMAAKDKDKKRQLVEKFTQFYENTATENSVTNFYKYLTGDQPSLSKNLLELTVTKFSGEVEKVKTYSTYFRGLMWKGLQLNLVYYKLKDFNTEAKAKQSIIQFYNITQAHTQTVLKCIENFEQYMKNDVKVIGTSEFLEMTPLATKVREFLNKKYFWYDWIVAVYKKEDASSHDMLRFTKISLEKFIVAVSFSEKGNHFIGNTIKEYASNCVKNIECSKPEVLNKLPECSYKYSRYGPSSYKLAMTQIAAIHISTKKDGFSETPDALIRNDCHWGFFSVYVKSDNQIKQLDPCSGNTDCGNGLCKRILDTSLTICECNEGFYGEKCEINIQDDVMTVNVNVGEDAEA